MLFKLHTFLAPLNSINFHSYFLGVSVQVWPKLLLPQHVCFHLVLKGHPRILRQKSGVFWWEWSKPCEVISLGPWRMELLGHSKQAALIASGLTGWACVSVPTSHRLHGVGVLMRSSWACSLWWQGAGVTLLCHSTATGVPGPCCARVLGMWVVPELVGMCVAAAIASPVGSGHVRCSKRLPKVLWAACL